MNKQLIKERTFNTPKGAVLIKSFCTPADIQQYTFDEEFLSYAQYKTIYTKRESLERDAASPDANVVLALTEQNHIIGFGVLVYPDTGERWLSLGAGLMMEVKVIEISRSWRATKIASEILGQVVDYSAVEDKIIYMVGYSWTWDLDHSELKVQEYRQILIKLFGSHDFKEYETNEANICLKVENLFLCRIGKNVPDDVIDQFNWLRFGIEPDNPVNQAQKMIAVSRPSEKQSLFTPLIEEAFTSLRIHYNWKLNVVNLQVSREWNDDTAWDQYNHEFTAESCLTDKAEYLGSQAVHDLYRKYHLEDYLLDVINQIKNTNHQGIECFYNHPKDIRLINFLHSSSLGNDHIYRAVRSGGIRFTSLDGDDINHLIEGLNLSRVMSYKNASANVPFGGCRISVQTEPIGPNDRERLGFIAYAIDQTQSLVGPDMGFEPELIDVMRREGFTRQVTGGWDSKIGPPGPFTAFGVYLALKEAAYATYSSLNLAGKKIVVQGIGAVGLPLIENYLIGEQADLFISDIDNRLIEHVQQKFPGQVSIVEPDLVSSFDGDIWIPCAGGGMISEDIIENLTYQIIIGAANNTLKAQNQTEEIRLAQLLAQKKILFQIDWMHNNAGVIGGAEEYIYNNQASSQRVMEQIELICRDRSRNNFREAALNKLTPTEQAYRHFDKLIY